MESTFLFTHYHKIETVCSYQQLPLSKGLRKQPCVWECPVTKFPLSSQGTDDLKFLISLLLLDPACCIQQDSPPCASLLPSLHFAAHLAVPGCHVQPDPMLHTAAHPCLSQQEIKVLSTPHRQTKNEIYYSFSARGTTSLLLACKKCGYIIIRYKNISPLQLFCLVFPMLQCLLMLWPILTLSLAFFQHCWHWWG